MLKTFENSTLPIWPKLIRARLNFRHKSEFFSFICRSTHTLLQCYICGEERTSANMMQDHIKTSHPEFDMIHILQMFGVPHNWKCSTCKQTFYTEKEQRMHQCGKPHPSWLGIPTDSTFTCEHCGDHIQKYLNYLFHVILHHFPEELNKIKNINLDKESLKQCKKCDYTTLETARFKSHMFEVHVGKVKCDQCKRKFHSLQALQNHQKTHQDGKETFYGCKTCGKQFNSNASLGQHRHLLGHDVISCEQCGKKCISEFAYRNHLKRHTEHYHKCSKCSCQFKLQSSLEQHMKKHQIVFMCSVCEDVLTSKERLLKHLIEKHGLECSIRNMTPCPLCKISFSSTKELNDHIHKVHNVAKEHNCDMCDRVYTTKCLLTMHKMEMHEFDLDSESMTSNVSIAAAMKMKQVKVIQEEVSASRKIVCNECGAKLKSPRVLDDHIRQKHRKETHQFSCNSCNFTTFTAFRLKKHWKSKHVKNYQCNLCDKAFGSNSILQAHIFAIHMKGPKYQKCPECPDSFTTKKALTNHLWREHEIIYKYEHDQLKLSK